MTGIQKLGELCRAWGGELRFLSSADEFNRFLDEPMIGRSMAPFECTHGIDWSTKLIVTLRSWARVGPMIHEMGHVFASSVPPDAVVDYGDPGTDEFDFFGWEIAVAKMIGSFGAWSASNDDYSISAVGRKWGECSRRERRRIADERTTRARELGLIDEFLRPVAIR